MSNIKIAVAALALLAATAATTTAFATEASYTCDGGTKLTALFSPVGATPGEVTLTIDGAPGPIVLPQVLAADGGRYADAAIEFWIKGNGATLTRPGSSVTCEVKPTGTAG